MRPTALAYLYLRRLRTHPVQELLAGAGIAIGVALTLAVQIANQSVTASAAEAARSIAGAASLQLSARSPAGVDQAIVGRVRALPGVRRAAGILEQPAVVAGPGGRVAVRIAGVLPERSGLGGMLGGNLAGARLGSGAILPRAVADELALGAWARRVELELRGRRTPVAVAAVPAPDRSSSFAKGRELVMALPRLQALADRPGRVTRVLVQPLPGREEEVRAGLTRLAAGRLDVGSPTDELRLLQQATRPGDRATAFFTMIAAIVGWLLAFNAMLLGSSERRRALAELRMQGFRFAQLVQITLFGAVALGAAASAIGLVAGSLLARGVLHESADYLTGAFTFGTQNVVSTATVVLTFAGGLAAACLASAPSLWAVRRPGPPAADAHATPESLGARAWRPMLAAAVALVVVTGALQRLAPATTIAAIVALAGALLLALPAIFTGAVWAAERTSTRAGRLALLVLALFGLRAARVRSLALAATGALAVFGSVAVASARDDLLRGIDRFTVGYTSTADLWVVHRDDDQATRDFAAGDLPGRLARVPGVAAVRGYHGGFVDLGDRRVWLVARPPGDAPPVPASEIERGDAARVARRLDAGGWTAMSRQLLRAQGVGVGDTVEIPTPSGTARLRVAAETTNFGWNVGAVVIGGGDYRRLWDSHDPAALEVDVRPGASARRVGAALRRELGPGSALAVLGAGERASRASASAREGVSRLGQISLVLLLGAALAMAAAMSAAIWQRRPALAALRLQSLAPSQLWRVLLAESAIVLGVGCVTGALAAVYGQFLIDRYLRLTTGFAAPFELAGGSALRALVLVMAMALVGVAVPGWIAAHAPARLGLQD